ncbi:MAG: Gfo/Idh/MocA family protein [Phycisphaeraceae bacterium]
MTAKTHDDDYALNKAAPDQTVRLPELDYRPPRPRRYQPKIGLIGCGGITQQHLSAYQGAGYTIAALTDLDRQRAVERRDAFYPQADVEDSAESLLARADIDVVDLALHPKPRAPLILDAIAAGKHVLSQKPFVLDLVHGQRAVEAADKAGVKLAVNQNGRWAPHVAWMHQAIEAGLIGRVVSVDTAVHWDHNWTADTPFNDIPHLLLYDFAIHWFDMLHCYTRAFEPKRVYASLDQSASQRARPPLLGQVQVEFAQGQATLAFRADTRCGSSDRTVIVGDRGTLISQGPNLNDQTVTIYTEDGQATPALAGAWFPDGFAGTMGELLVAIEQDREPFNSGRDNLEALELCFAAMQSAETGAPVRADEVQQIKPEWLAYPEAAASRSKDGG